MIQHSRNQRTFLTGDKSSTVVDSKDIDTALGKALENKSEKVRFGKKNEYEICWHGEAGYVKSYKTGEYFNWGLNSVKEGRKVIEISKEESDKKQAEIQRVREAQEKQKIAEEQTVAKKAKNYFAGFFKASLVNTTQNKYLQHKGISNKVIEGVKFTKDNKLVVPLQDTKGVIHSLQFINEDGSKIFMKNGKKIGCFFMIDSDKVKDSKEIYLAEGFATGVSIHLATNKPVAITFDAGNIEHVLKNLKEVHPNKEFTIAADNDLWKEHNVGKEKAEIAAQKYGAKVVLPNFTLAHKDEMPTDFNDLHKLSGLHELQKQLATHQVDVNRDHEHHHNL
jgi:putative DNA primase/helicase